MYHFDTLKKHRAVFKTFEFWCDKNRPCSLRILVRALIAYHSAGRFQKVVSSGVKAFTYRFQMDVYNKFRPPLSGTRICNTVLISAVKLDMADTAEYLFNRYVPNGYWKTDLDSAWLPERKGPRSPTASLTTQ